MSPPPTGPSARGLPLAGGRRRSLLLRLVLLLLALATARPSAWAAAPHVPGIVVPGARLLYETGSATQPDFQRPGSAGVGLTRYEVLADTGQKVLLRAGSFLSDGRGGYQFGGSSFVVVDAMAIKTGSTLWIDPRVLAGFADDAQTDVEDGGWQAGGQDWQARSLTRVRGDQASRLVFDQATGLLLAQQLATGQQRPGMTDPFMKQNTSSMAWLSHRQVALPWAGGAAPAWTATVQRLVYRGQQGLVGGYGPAVGAALTHTIDITERGAGWAVGTVRVELQGQPSTQVATGTGPGGLGSWWVDPAAMAAAPTGVVDRDPTLGTTVTLERTTSPAGPVAVVREVGSAHALTWVYSLQDGALVYTAYELSSLGMKTELELVSRQ